MSLGKQLWVCTYVLNINLQCNSLTSEAEKNDKMITIAVTFHKKLLTHFQVPYYPVADAGFLQGGCGSWCLWNAPIPFMPSLPPTLKKISWEPAAR